MQSRLSFPRPSAPAGLVFCLWFHLWKGPQCEAATKETEPTCRHSFVESQCAGAKGCLHKGLPPPSHLLRCSCWSSTWREIAATRDCAIHTLSLLILWISTQFCANTCMQSQRDSHFQVFYSPPPPWHRRNSFSQSCVSFHSHTHTHPAHTQNTHLFGLCTSVAFPLLFIKPTYG